MEKFLTGWKEHYPNLSLLHRTLVSPQFNPCQCCIGMLHIIGEINPHRRGFFYIPPGGTTCGYVDAWAKIEEKWQRLLPGTRVLTLTGLCLGP